MAWHVWSEHVWDGFLPFELLKNSLLHTLWHLDISCCAYISMVICQYFTPTNPPLLHLDALQPCWEESWWYHCRGGGLCVYKYRPFTGPPLCEIELGCVGLCLHQDTTGEQIDGGTSQCSVDTFSPWQTRLLSSWDCGRLTWTACLQMYCFCGFWYIWLDQDAGRCCFATHHFQPVCAQQCYSQGELLVSRNRLLELRCTLSIFDCYKKLWLNCHLILLTCIFLNHTQPLWHNLSWPNLWFESRLQWVSARLSVPVPP